MQNPFKQTSFFFLVLILILMSDFGNLGQLQAAKEKLLNRTQDLKANFENIEIFGFASFRTKIMSAITLLKEKAYYDFVDFQTYVKKIEPSYSTHSFYDPQSAPPTIRLGTLVEAGSDVQCALTLVHEGCHAKSYDTLRKNGNPSKIWNMTQEEKRCIDHEVEVLKKLGGSEIELNRLRHLDGKHWDLDQDGKLTSKDRIRG